MPALLALLALANLDVRTDGCGSAQELREEVRLRLGHDPAPDAPAQFDVVIAAKGSQLEARLTTTTAGGPTTRVFTSPDCRELIESVALAIAITLDPNVFLAGPAAPPAPALAPAAAPPTPAPEPAPPVLLSLAPSVRLMLGLAGPFAGGGGVSLRARRGEWSIALEGRVDIPATLQSGDMDVSAYSVLGAIVPGWHRSWLRLSLPISLGALQVTGGGPTPIHQSTLLVLAGLELAGRWALTHWVGLEPFVRFQANATRVTVLSGPLAVWTTWPITVEAGLAIPFEVAL